jgi:hypothetical protein
MRDVQTPLALDSAHTRHGTTRRDFLRLAGLGGAALLLPSMLTACSEDLVDPRLPANIDLNTDAGVRNFAYLLAQYQWGFYQYVMALGYPGMRALESRTYSEINLQVTSQRSLFAAILPNGIPSAVRFDFDKLGLLDRGRVLEYAAELADTMAAAYNGLLLRARSEETLMLLAKIASVQSRQAAALRDLRDIAAGNANSALRVAFAAGDAVSPQTGGARIMAPVEALERLRPYIITTVSLRGA